MVHCQGFGRKLLTIFLLALLVRESPICASDDQQTESKPRKDIVPTDLQDWKIRFDGFAGTPGDRSWFRVSLGHDGQIKVEKRRVRRGDYRTVLNKKLDEKETDEFFRTAAKIINERHRNNRRGKMQDGWQLTLGASS